MTEPCIAHTNELLQNPQKVVSRPRRDGWRCTLQRLASVLLLTGVCGMMLTGCQDFWDTTADLIRLDGGEAEAQDATETRVQTYVIDADGFEIVLDNDTDPTPLLNIVNDATQLTMQSEGDLIRGTGGSSVPLEVNDIIILRLNGTTGTATLIRND